MDGMLIVTIIGVAVTTLGLAAAGLWAYNEAVKFQFKEMDTKFTEGFKTIFRRVDDNKNSYWTNFVSKEVHEIQIKNINDQMAIGFKNLSDKIDNLGHKFNKEN